METAIIAPARTVANQTTARILARYEEWHNETRDVADGGSVYTLLASLERTVRASELDLGLDA